MEKIFDLKKIIINTLDSNKALDIVSINLENKSSMADYLIIASGTSSRHMQALSEIVLEKFKSNHFPHSMGLLLTRYSTLSPSISSPTHPA